MRGLSNVFFALLVAGFLMPFVWQLIKVKVLKFAGKLAFLATFMIDAVLAFAVLYWYKDFTLFNWIGATIIVFVVAHTVYDHIIQRFFPGKGAV